MALADCLATAVAGGEISEAESRALLRRFDQLQRERGQAPGAAAAAKVALEQEMRAEAVEARRIVALTEAVRARVVADVVAYRTAKGEADIMEGVLGLFEHFGFHGYSSVEGRTKAIVGAAHARMEEALATFDRSAVLGRRRNQPQLEQVVRELFGEDTKNPAAKRMAEVFAEVAEDLRQRFNGAGGAIGKLDGWGLPQSHDARALLSVGRDEWKSAIRPRLDLDRMRDPLTGERLGAERLDEALDRAFERIVTNGEIDIEPKGVALGSALRNQRSEHRFLIFKSPDDWLAYAADFGQGDPFAAMMSHVRGMARDIAAMEILGPNPGATVEWLKQWAKVERAKLTTGEASLWRGGPKDVETKAGLIDYRVDALWQEIRGNEPVSGRLAMGFAAVRSALTSALLGSASVTAVATDPFVANAAKRLSGLPTTNYLASVVKTFTGASRAEAIRSGLMLEDAMHVMGKEARYAGSLGGPVWTNWLADRTLTLSGLSPWTQARKHLFGMEMQAFAADEAGKAFDAIDPRFRRMLEGYGIDSAGWDVIRAAEPHKPPRSAGVLRPVDVMAADRAVGERWLEAIMGETERAVPSGTKRMRAYARAGTAKGTVTGEFVDSFMQFKAFGLSLTMLQLEAVGREMGGFGRAAGARYAGSLLFGLTMGGALASQLRQIANGKDPQPMDDARFWMGAIKTGGGFGLYGDFLFADQNRFGQDVLTAMAGPTFGLVTDVTKATLGNVQKVAKGDDTETGKDVVGLARRYTPVASSLFYARAGWNRVFMDQLQFIADPDAHRRFRDMERRTRREYDQGYWWRPGDLGPARAPELGNVAGDLAP
ncbi:hypothetical protein SAMN04515666_101357 [Bosea lupini]|uniref:Uncharacterized protein n=1 Tax=Bosea lupini TaxID=1036779 RepID=A0A1H7GJ08_9HYPH|nr:hypothetical protein [Bosea lupini]SEK37527.1 hypothetical protein SAMN04515666_101357 [Bosea lupini]